MSIKGFCIAVPAFLLSFVGGQTVLAQTDQWVHTNSLPVSEITSLAVNAGGDIFAGTFSDGIYRSTDEASTWVRSDSGIVDTALTALGVGAGGLVFAGTVSGVGLYRSTDYGTTWKGVVFDSAGASMTYVNSVYVDLQGQVFLSADGYLYRSADNGLHWKKISARFYTESIVSNPDGILFAAAMGVSRSSDNGDSWEEVNTGLADSIVTVVAVDSLGYIYAGTYGEGVFRSADNGNLWSRVDSGFINGYIGALVIGRSGDIFVGTLGSGVYRSTDNGDHWTAFSRGLSSLTVYQLALGPDGYVYAGTNGGMYRTTSSTPLKQRPEGSPERFILEQNYPDPFNPATRIPFALPRESIIRLSIHDLLGREVKVLLNGRLTAGYHEIPFDAGDLPSGVYFYRLVSPGFSGVRKMVFLR